MNEMKNKLKKYYEEVGIASVEPVKNENGCYDYEEMFRSFCCPKKDCCREVCERAYKPSPKNEKFTFSPRTQGVEVSQYYAEKKYKGHRIPRIVVVSLSTPQPVLKQPEQVESKPFSLRPYSHWRGTTTTIRSLLDPFYRCLDPVEDSDSLKIIEKLFVHVRTAKCFSNVGGSRQEPAQLYKNCGGYLSEEVSILKPDVVITQGYDAHRQVERHVFDENAKKTTVEKIEGIDYSIAYIVRLKEDNRKVYWLRSCFPGWGGQADGKPFYSEEYAGLKVDSEGHSAKRENLVRYGRDIKKFMDEEGR